MLLAATIAAGLVARAADDVADRHALLLARLDAADYADREAATCALMGDADLSPPRWRALLDAATTPEQTHRLAAVGVHLMVRERIAPFLSNEHPGALGIHHVGAAAGESGGDSPAGVRVMKTEPGFPAHAVLRAGDIITAIDGQPLTAAVPDAPPPLLRGQADPQAIAEELVGRIREIGCGRTTTLTLWRDGHVQHAAVTLSSQPVLQQIITRNLAAEAEAAILRDLEPQAD